MSGDAILLAILVVWLLTGVTLSVVLGRRGHDAGSWLVLGALFGPFAALLALESVEREAAKPEVLAVPQRHEGDLDVLVGFDGSPASEAALAYVQDLLRDRIDRLTLVTAVPYEGATTDERAARQALQAVSQRTHDGFGLDLIRGRPGVALPELAQEQGYDLLVVGTSADDRSHLLGDAAIDLARESSLPVLVVPPTDGRKEAR